MRRLFLGFAALSLLFGVSSCVKETSESAKDGNNELEFRTVLGKQSRATEFTNTSWVNGDTLNVHAYVEHSTSEAYGGPIKITYNNGGDTDPANDTWTPATAVTSLGTRVHYYTWYPNDDTKVTNQTSGENNYTFDYTVAAEASQEDLVATKNVVESSPDVTLALSHILSQVNFGIVETFGMKINILETSIQLTDINNTGTYTMGAPEEPAVQGWSGQSGTASYTYTPNGAEEDGDYIATDGTVSGIMYLGNMGGSDPEDNANDNALMLMPQSFDSTSTAALSFQYFLEINDGSTPRRVPAAEGTTITANVLLKDFDTNAWAEGKRYLYLFDFSSYLATGEITFTVSVGDWEDDDQNTVAETIQVADATLESIEEAIAKHSAANAASTGLTVFPISVPEAIASVSEGTITTISGFDANDQIRIECVNADSATVLLTAVSSVTGWTATTDANNNRVLILTKDE